MRTFNNTNEIRTERAANRNNPGIYSLLGVILGELDRRPNQHTQVTAQDIYKVIKKLYEAAIECGNKEEEQYLEDFIQNQLSTDELRNIIKGIINDSEINNIGGIMKYLSTHYSGRYDGKMASMIARELL